MKLSACCNAPVDIGGDDKEGTHYYICFKCGKACDVAPKKCKCNALTPDECQCGAWEGSIFYKPIEIDGNKKGE